MSNNGKTVVKCVGLLFVLMSALLLFGAIARASGIGDANVTPVPQSIKKEALAYLIGAVVMGAAAARMFFLVKSGRV